MEVVSSVCHLSVDEFVKKHLRRGKSVFRCPSSSEYY
jgi:hypothetical protein